MTIFDSFSRPIEYLRLSVTDRCNLRCVYCMPPGGIPWRPQGEILRYEELEQIVRVAAGLGIRKVRLTGGEPLVRRGLLDFIVALARIPGIEDLSMTTNGVLLPRFAEKLASAGLRRVNVSLDSLVPERFARITRKGVLIDVLAGIEAAHNAGLRPVKINVVVIRGLNDDEVVPFAQKTKDQGWHVRFIEFMPVGRWHEQRSDWWKESFVPTSEIRQYIERALGPLHPQDGLEGAGPARHYRLAGAKGTVGFISAVSEHFCTGCNRLRLSADGRLRPCLLSDQEVDLRSVLRTGGGEKELRDCIIQAVQRKPRGHHLDEGAFPQERTMSEIGG